MRSDDSIERTHNGWFLHALRFAHEAGLLPDEEWSALNDGQARARFLTWQLYQALGR